MTPEAATQLFTDMFRVMLVVSGPVLLACLLAGLGVGVMQTATQVNEPSVSYLVKLVALTGVLLVAGAAMSSHVLEYTRSQFAAVSKVVR